MRTICFGLLVAATAVASQQPQQTPTVRTTTAGVVLDVSVVDQRGQPILDLKPEDFEVSEDGKRQDLLSLKLVQNGTVRTQGSQTPAPGATVAATPSGSPPAAQAQAISVTDTVPTVTAILFDRLSPETRAVAGRAALAYIGTLAAPHEYAGVFLSDIAFATAQPFTNQTERLREGVQRVVTTAPSNLSVDAERAKLLRLGAIDPSQPVTPGAEASEGWMGVAERERRLTQPGSEGALARMEWNMWQSYRPFLTEYEGQTSLAGLRAVVVGLSALPGRKSILYFTESLQITDRLKARYDAMVGEANRANITIYPVDAAGLRVHSKEAEVNRNVTLAGAQGVGDARRADEPYTRELEHQEQLLSSRPTAILGRLAKETGGFLLENTNELSAGVARMQQERTTYYLLGYQPTNAALDGKFHRVTVKVKRPKVTVKARPGYLAAAPQQ
ncbi:MAG: VWA domain-containing protein [Vicinamibacterales bacterium]